MRTGIKPSSYRKSYKISRGIQAYIVNFKVSNKQFWFMEISLVYDKSDEHRSMYNSHNSEIASTKIDPIKWEKVEIIVIYCKL